MHYCALHTTSRYVTLSLCRGQELNNHLPSCLKLFGQEVLKHKICDVPEYRTVISAKTCESISNAPKHRLSLSLRQQIREQHKKPDWIMFDIQFK